jgi:arylsulfatase A-like enzyme
LQDTGYSTTLLGHEAAKVIRQPPKNKPLFLYVPFNGVHAPLQVPESHQDAYRDLPPRRRSISGMFSAIDESVGEILKALDETGRRQNTLIAFASDNGGPNANDNAPLRGRKGTVYEGGVRSSGVVSRPRHVKPGAAINEPLHIVDFYPTFLGLTGASLDSRH